MAVLGFKGRDLAEGELGQVLGSFVVLAHLKALIEVDLYGAEVGSDHHLLDAWVVSGSVKMLAN